MAKNKVINNDEIIVDSLENIFSDRFARYSKYIIQDRALPDARDGLKPVQRRILYAMHYDGNTHDKAYRKSAKSVGLIIGNFHPHGDSSVYDAMVRLSQWWKNNEILVDMHGNNGSIDDDAAAAMRYTEARLSKFSSLLLKDIDYATVSWAPNFDDTLLEPTVLPAEIPLLLINGALGIATGYATDIPPHNLNEVIDATIYRIHHPECEVEELLELIKGPDFPTGGIIQGKNELINAYKKGRGKIVVRSKCEIVQKNNMSQIIITEIPYDVIKVKLVKEIDDRRFDKKVDGISDVRDESGREGLKIVIDIKKDYDPELILKYLYANTKLQINYNFNMVAIVDERPKLMSLIDILDSFIAHKKAVVLKRSQFLMAKKQEKCHILDGLIKAVSIMDDVIELIRRSKDKADAKNRLIEAFLFTEQQSEAIVSLRLYRLTNTDIKALKEEHSLLTKEIFELKQIIQNPMILQMTVIEELKAVKDEFGKERKTVIEDQIEDVKIDKIEMMVNERVMISVSYDGYLKKTSLRSFNSTEGIGGIKEGDKLIGYMETDSLDALLLITNLGNYAYLPIYEIDEAKWKDIGKHLNTYVKLENNEKIIDVINVKNFNTYAYVLMATKKGMIKKTPLADFVVSRHNKTFTAMKFKTDDELISAKVVYAHDEVIVISTNSYCNYYSTDLINDSGLKSSGIRAINLENGDYVSKVVVIGDQQYSLALFSDKGMSKRIRLSDLKKTNRGLKGYRLSKYIKSNPQLVKEACICKSSDIIAAMDNNDLLEIELKNIPFMDLDANYSNVYSLTPDYWLLADIQNVKIIDFPIDYNKMQDQQIGIFDNDD